MKKIEVHPVSLVIGAVVGGFCCLSVSFGPAGTGSGLSAEQEAILGHMSLVGIVDAQGTRYRTLRISGANLQVVNGSDSTAGEPDGLGNLIVGYNEVGFTDFGQRSGSHNIITGTRNSYDSYAGLLAGSNNTLEAPNCSILGGVGNRARAASSVITGGFDNQTLDFESVVSGGRGNIAAGYRSWVAGGGDNVASSIRSAVCGGLGNTADGDTSTVTGGRSNTASGDLSVVSGGDTRSVAGEYDWAAGGLFQDN